MNRLIIPVALLALLALAACESKQTPAPTPDSTPPAPAAAAAAADDKPEDDAPATDRPPTAQDDVAPSQDPGILGVGSTPEDIAAGASNTYGARFTLIEEPITLASAIEKAATSEGPYKVNATIEKVCQVKGCWFTIKADDVPIPVRVRMKDYKFFVPMNAGAMPAVVEGTFKRVTISQKEAQHYADDEAANSGQPAKQIEGPQDSWEFTATAIQIEAPEKG